MNRRSKLAVFVASRFIPEVRAEFESAFEACFDSSPNPVDAILDSDRDFDCLLISLDAPMRAKAIGALPASVRAIATYSVGTDHIDLFGFHLIDDHT